MDAPAFPTPGSDVLLEMTTSDPFSGAPDGSWPCRSRVTPVKVVKASRSSVAAISCCENQRETDDALGQLGVHSRR